MTADGNKGINVAYNLLNLPQQVWNGANEKIYYLYDASGRKLSQIVSNAAGAQTKLTDYHGEYIYENDTLRFANHEEGRVIMTGGEPEYQYHLKDHLGNVRMTFTTKDEADSARATLEDNHRTQDSLNFLNYRNARLVYSQIFDKTNGSSPGYAQRLSGAPNERIGLARSFSVMPGDKIKARVYAKYFEAADTTAALQTLFGFFANPAASGGVVIDGGGYSNAEIGSSLPWMGTDPDPDEELPKAYLNYIFINRDYDMNSLAFVAKQISENALEDGSDGDHELLEFEETVKEDGYVYVYLSNDGEEVKEVYFDDFKVEHVKSPVIESQDYYPFGLTYNSYQRESSLENRWKFQGQEHIDDLGLNWDAFKWRNHQPDIGRFFGIDPLSEKYYHNSPYAFSENHVTTHVELEGLEKVHFSVQPVHRDGLSESGDKFGTNRAQPFPSRALNFTVDMEKKTVMNSDCKGSECNKGPTLVTNKDGSVSITSVSDFETDGMVAFKLDITNNEKDGTLGVKSSLVTENKTAFQLVMGGTENDEASSPLAALLLNVVPKETGDGSSGAPSHTGNTSNTDVNVYEYNNITAIVGAKNSNEKEFKPSWEFNKQKEISIKN